MKTHDSTELIDHLSAQRALAGCTSDDLQALLRAGTPTVIPSHWAFVQESTPADAVYVLLEGNARVYRRGVPVADLDAGDVVGETALLDGTLRNATVSSLAPVRALRIDRRSFDKLVEQRPAVRTALRQVAAERRAAS